MSTENTGPVINIATDNVVMPTQDPIPYPQASIPVRVSGLDHFGLDYPDLEAAERWYAEVLGATVVTRRGWGGGVERAKPHTDMRLGDDPGCVISMFIGETSELRPGSSIHFCLRCKDAAIEDLESWKDHLLSKGVHTEIWGHFGCGAISTYFRDPWNYRFEVTTNYPDWPAAEKTLVERGYPYIGQDGKYPKI